MTELLRDETSQVDLVAPTLPALKAYCQRATRSSEQSQLPRALNGLLSGILQNVDDVKSRSDKAAVLKLKNNLLAAVLLLTCLPSSVKIGQAVVEHACFLISQIALDGESEVTLVFLLPQLRLTSQQMARTAMHCLATLLITGPRSSGVVQYCLTQLLPTIVEYIARVAESDRIPSEAELSVLTEVLKAFISVFDAVPATQSTFRSPNWGRSRSDKSCRSDGVQRDAPRDDLTARRGANKRTAVSQCRLAALARAGGIPTGRVQRGDRHANGIRSDAAREQHPELDRFAAAT